MLQLANVDTPPFEKQTASILGSGLMHNGSCTCAAFSSTSGQDILTLDAAFLLLFGQKEKHLDFEVGVVTDSIVELSELAVPLQNIIS